MLEGGKVVTPHVLVIQPRGGGPNPYVHLLSEHLKRLDGITVVHYSRTGRHARAEDMGEAETIWHIHFPEHVLSGRSTFLGLLRCCLYLVRLAYVRKRGTRLVWTLHNLRSHNSAHPTLEKLFRTGLCHLVDGWISMSGAVARAAEERYPLLGSKASSVIPHGHYRDVYPREISPSDARSKLGLTEADRVILFFGAVRPYKNLVRLIECFRELPGETLRLVIAGSCQNTPLRRDIIRSAAGDSRVRLHMEFIPDDQAQVYFGAADLVALPFSTITNSGSALLALSFGVPTLVPNLGSMGDLAALVGEDWVRTYDGEIKPEVLRDGLDWASQARSASEPDLGILDWSRIASSTLAFYRTVLSPSASA